MTIVITLALALGLAIRLLPIFLKWDNFGVDHWYWNAYIKTLKEKKKFPPDLPNYVLEDAQWYPPLFPLLLARFPSRILERYGYLIAASIDLARMLLMFFFMKLLGIATPRSLAVAGVFYATTPILACYNTQLNPRSLAAFFLDVFYVVLAVRAGSAVHLSPVIFWALAVLSASAVLLIHKMNGQLMVFSLVGLSVLLRDWTYAALIPLSIVGAALISNGFYLKVLRHNVGFVRFWSRQWPLLGADPIRESPLYGIKDFKGRYRQFEPGVRNMLKRFFSLSLGNYAPVVSGALAMYFFCRPMRGELTFVAAWLATGYAFAFLTVMVPLLRGLGFGNLYLYNAAFPACVLLGYGSDLGSGPVALVLVALFAINGVALFRSLKHLGSQKGLTLPSDVVAEVAKCGSGSWLAYPMQLVEHIAYLAGKPVLYAAHGDEMKRIGQVFPVLRRPVPELMREYDLRYILVDDHYLEDLSRIPVRQERRFSGSGYHIVELLSNAR